MKPHGAAWLSLLLALGCSVRSEDAGGLEPTANECSENAECGEEGRCIAGRCEARAGELSTVLFEVTAPGSNVSDDLAGLSFIQTRHDLSPTGGALELALGDVAEITGSVEAPPRGRLGCAYDFRLEGAPLRVTFTPTERLLGLPTTVYTALASNSGCDAGDDVCQRLTNFGVRVPPGEYQLYVQSAPQSETGLAPTFVCTVVPQLYRSVQIDVGQVDLPLVLPEPGVVTLQVVSALDGATGEPELEGWVLDLLDPKSGRRLSTSPVLADASVEGDLATFQVELEYSPAVGDQETSGQELVRLSPPEAVAAPAVLMERAALELFTGEAVIDQLAPLPHSIELEGRVERESTEAAVATVTVEATQLDFLQPGTLASYQRTVETDEAGRFSVEVLPGAYRVFAVPPIETGLAVFETEWDVAAEPRFQAGRTITLVEGSLMVGRVLSPTNQPVAGANVLAVAPPSVANATALQAALGEAPFVPRASSVVSDAHGEFELSADPPRVDVSVRPLAGTGFAWLVRPEVPVTVPDLRDMVLPLPVAYQGRVTVRGTSVLPEARIRAYVMLCEDGYTTAREQALGAVQVAEARANDRGRFELLLPRDMSAASLVTQ